ncbi:MAG: AAA family ATPase [Chloroflexota bacterium]|nr:MAG: AAA family ATPase [Chloroflexota bacterium]
MVTVQPLDATVLCRPCDPDRFSFNTTAELEDLEEVIGQERAVEAIRFGIGIQRQGYNLFALGPNGTGKYTSVHRSLSDRAISEPVPADWCYVYNFDQPHSPKALRLPAGQGVLLLQGMEQMVDELFAIIAAAYEGEEYQTQRRAIEAEVQNRQESALEDIRVEAEANEIALIRTPAGLAFAPLRDKQVIKPEEFMELPEERRKEIESQIEDLQQKLQSVIRQVPDWIREGRRRVRELNEEVAVFTVSPLFDEIKANFDGLPHVLAYLEAVQADVVKHNHMFVDSGEDGDSSLDPADAGVVTTSPKKNFANRYRVNVIVDHGESEGAPVIYEQNPTYTNLIGRLEHVAQMGALLTDFTLIKPGALHQANGGYLILDARKVILQPFAWEGLKQALRAEEIRIESPGQAYGLVSTVALEPQPVPLDVKVILLGERLLYYLLHQHDPDFGELFKVAADFEDQMDRSDDNDLAYARLISTLARKESLRHFDRPAVAKVIERSARLAGDSERLSTHMQSVADLLREADYWAGEADAEIVSGAHVQQAIEAQTRRAGRVQEQMQEAILRETIFVDTAGEKTGQINGLSVLMLGNYAFGRPNRITARVRMGKGEVIDIERQVELGGPLHSKGVLILSSYLGSRYAASRPLSLSASLVFEQSYGGVDGDSASSAELYALLSALAEAPIKQSLAVTGSVNQHGQVQAIGGVNEKIEGFYDICLSRGLSGDQGVLVPAANVKHLMLRQDVVDAVAEGDFNIYPIETIEQGIEVLTGVPAGEMDDDGSFPNGTINRLVVDRLDSMAETQRAFNRPPEQPPGNGQELVEETGGMKTS